MAPGDDTGAGIVVVGFLDNVSDFLVGLGGDLVDEGVGQNLAELGGHFLGALCDGVQNFGAVQELRADHEPESVFHMNHVSL